jgi:hypothetical protein
MVAQSPDSLTAAGTGHFLALIDSSREATAARVEMLGEHLARHPFVAGPASSMRDRSMSRSRCATGETLVTLR